MKRVNVLKLVLVPAFVFVCVSAWGRAPAPQPLTLLVIPERVNLVQVSFDVVDKRPVALVSYRRNRAGETILHAWTGSRWLPIEMAEYDQGGFLVRQPDRIVLVGDERLLPPAVVTQSQWGPMVLGIGATDTDEFLNQLGRLLEFTPGEWRWFASRYNMAIEDVSPPREHRSWYEQMTEARQLPPRRHIDDLPSVDDPVPIKPMPVRSPEDTVAEPSLDREQRLIK